MADDSDIKIYVGKAEKETQEFENLSENIRRHISNGNKEKAEQLGIKFAKIKPEDSSLDFNQYNFSASELYQIRVLMTFVAEYIIEKTLKDDFLDKTIVNSLFDYLKENETGYYDNISDGCAFTFYLLALKKTGDTAQNIGEQFAMLCGINRPEMINFGADVFNKTCAFFTGMIDATDFKE